MHRWSFKQIHMKKRLMSFRYAWEGIVSLFSNERNAQIHLGAAVCVIIAGCLFDLSAVEWCMISLCIGGVFMAEGFNTAIEKVCDKVSPERDPLVKTAKDVAAGAVLLFVISAVVVGFIVFIPHFLKLI